MDCSGSIINFLHISRASCQDTIQVYINKNTKNPPQNKTKDDNAPFRILKVKFLDALFFLLFKFYCLPPCPSICQYINILSYHFSSRTSDCIQMNMTQICTLAVSDIEFLARQCLNACFPAHMLPTHLIGLTCSLVPVCQGFSNAYKDPKHADYEGKF